MQEVSLQYAPIVAKPVIHVSQYDVGRQFKFKIYDGVTAYTMPVGTTARVEGIKPDGHGFSYDDCVSVTDNIATVTTKLQMTIVAGSVECELRFSDGSDDIGTLNFTLLVEESPVNPDTDISDTEIPAIIELARAQMENAEAWAVGERNGVPVGPTDPTYHNNAKYYSDHAGGVSLDGLTDVDIQSLTNGQYIKYNSTAQKWENTSDTAEKSNTTDFLSLSNTGTQIPDNSDLNSYITPGKYYVSNGTSANTLSNAPTITGGFTMFVLERTNGPQRTQIIYMNNSGACDQYIRNHDTNTHNWSSWQKLAFDSQIQTLANSLATETTNRQNADSNIVTTIAKNGAMNLAPNDATTQVVSGVTFSIDKTNSATNGIITLSGTASEAITLVLSKFKVPIGSYVLSSKADGSKARVTVEAYNGNTWKSLLASTASSDDVSFNVDYSNYDTLWISVRIDSGTNVNGVVVKPMVSVIAGEYVPYAKTNRELTEDVQIKTYNLDSEKGANVTYLAARAVKMGDMVFLTGSFKGNNTSSEEILTVPQELRPIASSTVTGTGFGAKSSEQGSCDYIIKNTGKMFQGYSSSAIIAGSFTIIYSISKS